MDNDVTARKRLIHELFGSDDEGGDEFEEASETHIKYSDILPGLKLFPQFLCLSKEDSEEIADDEEEGGETQESEKEEDSEPKRGVKKTSKRRRVALQSANELLSTVMSIYPFTKDLNQVMAFGELPHFILPVVESLGSINDLFPRAIMERKPLFDQMICNYYEPGQGITPHVDILSKFEDGIVILSLGSCCVMDFRPVMNVEEDEKYAENKQIDDSNKISVLLKPGDVLSISGDARYKWTHGIEKRLSDEWKGQSIPRGKRVSITLRRMIPNAPP